MQISLAIFCSFKFYFYIQTDVLNKKTKSNSTKFGIDNSQRKKLRFKN